MSGITCQSVEKTGFVDQRLKICLAVVINCVFMCGICPKRLETKFSHCWTIGRPNLGEVATLSARNLDFVEF